MKTFTVIQAGNRTIEMEADEPGVSTWKIDIGHVVLLLKGKVVFSGPAAYTTVIDNDAVKEKLDV